MEGSDLTKTSLKVQLKNIEQRLQEQMQKMMKGINLTIQELMDSQMHQVVHS